MLYTRAWIPPVPSGPMDTFLSFSDCSPGIQSVTKTQHHALHYSGQLNRLVISVYGLPRPGMKGELMEKQELATVGNVTGIRI